MALEALAFLSIFLIALVPLTLTIWLLVYAARGSTRQVGACRRCGYDLHHLGPRRHCPECGQPFYVNSNGDPIS